MILQLKHKDTSILRGAPVGFSWTSLFFGPFVPLLRGDFLWFFLHVFLSLFVFGLFWLIFPFIYNNIYLRGLLGKGYVPADRSSRRVLVELRMLPPDAIGSSGDLSMNEGRGSLATPSLSKVDVPSVGISAVDASAELESIVAKVLNSHSAAKKAYAGALLPADLRAVVASRFPLVNLNSERLLFAGLYDTRMFFYRPVYGVLITDKRICWRLCYGYIQKARVGSVQWGELTSVSVAHSYSHACYGGGMPGPELSINGSVVGWCQQFGLMGDDDEKLLIELFDSINKSGFFMRDRR